MFKCSPNELTEQQVRAFKEWLGQDEYAYFEAMALSAVEDELSRATRDPRLNESPDALSLDRERALAKLQVHRAYAKLRETIADLIPSAGQK